VTSQALGRAGFVLLLGVLTGCTGGEPSGGGAVPSASRFLDESAPFEESLESLDALGEAVLNALASRDRVALERLRLTELEHNEVVWPELPASAPEVNFPVDFAWSNIQMRNEVALQRIGSLFGDEPLVFRSVECRGGSEVFETFEVLTDCWVIFEREGVAHPYEAQIFKDVLVRGGGHKIFRYYDEEPRAYTGGERERLAAVGR
jgi:hypothetical protein